MRLVGLHAKELGLQLRTLEKLKLTEFNTSVRDDVTALFEKLVIKPLKRFKIGRKRTRKIRAFRKFVWAEYAQISR